MRLFYLDPGLRSDVGHHANYCRYIVGGLRARGVETLVFAEQMVNEGLQSELGARPSFRRYTYAKIHPDPIAGWLLDFMTTARITHEDLRQLPVTSTSDVVYASSVRPAQLMALLAWRNTLAQDRRPTVIVESFRTGMKVTHSKDGIKAAVPNPQIDPLATLYRYVANWLPVESDARFYVVTFDSILSKGFNLLLNYPIQTLPLPYPAIIPLRNRAGARPVVVAILGHHQAIKGYGSLPEIVEELLRTCPDMRLLLQLVDPVGPPEIQVRLREMAANDDRVVLDERPAGKTLWSQLLEMADLILCPHRGEFYQNVGFSAVMAEALANGIPVVVPGDTPLERLMAEYGGPGTTFDRFSPAAIAAATRQALDQFDDIGSLAHAAALSWPEKHGPARMVGELLSLIGAGRMDA